MRLFNTVSLEINSRCNRRCEFCPVAYNHRPDEQMDWALYEKAIHELSTMHYRGRIEFYIYNEPMRDKEHLYNALRLARNLVVNATLMIATNGDYLKGTAGILELFENGLNQLLINCYSPRLYERRLPWLEGLPPWIAWKRNNSVYNSTRRQVVQMLDKSKPDAFGKGVFGLINRAGNIPEFIAPVTEPMAKMCVKPFRLLNINWTGDALVCCNDYHGDMAYGNLADATLVELWNHPVMNRYRINLKQKKRGQPLCDVCDCHSGAYPHNVDVPTGPAASTAELYQLYTERKAAHGASASSHRRG